VEWLFLYTAVGAVGLGIGTAALAKRYNRDPLEWGIFGAFLFVIALPVLLLKGPLTQGRVHTAQRRAHLPGRGGPAQRPTAPKRTKPASAAAGTAERLRHLAELHAEGLVSDAEYDTRRKKILDEL